MSFSSFSFFIFYIFVLILNYILPKRFRWGLLLLASYVFYLSADYRFGFFLAGSTLVTYFCGLAIEQKEDRKHKKFFMRLAVLLNLGILFIFKYLNFFFGSIAAVLAKVGFSWDFRGLELLIPLGISFYVFQTISYIVDVYNGKTQAEKHLGYFALYVSFFPQLLAGPIERANHLIPQLRNPKPFDYQVFVDSLVRIGWGLFKKIVIADRLAVVVNTVFSNPRDFYSPAIGVAILFFSFQVYIDFSAYTDIALGTAKILGIDLIENFDRPYFSTSVIEFWRRWHISLSNWLRDYLFVPMTFKVRRKKHRALWQYFIVIVVFLISGIWHGANWTYMVWGGLHGAFQVFELATQKLRNKLVKKWCIDRSLFAHRVFQIGLTFGLVTFAWVFFRAESIRDAIYMLRSIATLDGTTAESAWVLDNLGLDSKDMAMAVHTVVFFILFEMIQHKHNILKALNSQPLWFRWSIYLALIFSIVIVGFYGNFTPQDFVYFKF